MPGTEATATTDLVTSYSARLASDLERNAEEQDGIRAELKQLEARLGALQQSHAVLMTMCRALRTGIPLRNPAASAGGNTAARASSGRGADGPRHRVPTLVSLVRAQLGERSGPCSCREIAVTLSEAHPDRAIKTTVVRTTLEGLVARGEARRIKMGHAVRYVAV
ncbi:hypothetical protein Shyhy01_20500 [Streptomyces hygroscopicus subsp. hygroscopicus]|uniref:hypothetical protein n=1 Tax=Streptomyces sp. KHY 26 TaxID=3097359 RepID=UPI00249FD69E|nr:hypothetical protein [Streptomyces hygroscopicus]GLX49100.1 hypothetical protein Shyhy01_20500 [Streptomyces hygroscopicus subsp. hygroscopicus]